MANKYAHFSKARENYYKSSAINMCINKRKFWESTAKRIAADKQQRPYKCPMCYKWHLTSNL